MAKTPGAKMNSALIRIPVQSPCKLVSSVFTMAHMNILVGLKKMSLNQLPRNSYLPLMNGLCSLGQKSGTET